MNDLLYVGVDVAKAKLDVAFGATGKPFSVDNDRAGITKLLEKVAQQEQQQKLTCCLVVEGSGGYERMLIAEALQNNVAIAHVNPRRVRALAESMGLAKTDPIDARVIAKFGQVNQPRALTQSDLPQRDLQELVDRRRQLIDFRTAENCRLQQVASKLAANSIRGVLKLLEKQIKNIEADIQSLIEKHDDWSKNAELLTSIKGVGDTTAAAVLADAPEIGQLNREEIAALGGVAPMNNDSGTHQGKRSIKGGRASLRTAIDMSALSAMKCNPAIKEFADRLKLKGKPAKVVITAVMRKLLTIMNAIIKTQQPWRATASVAAAAT